MRFPANILGALALSALPAQAAWQDLFNGKDLDGWDPQEKANWQVREGILSVSDGKQGLLTSTGTYQNCELEVEFRAEAGTNSGIFLSAPKTVTNPGSECYEVAIAPEANAYPTGSLAGRSRHAGAGEIPGWGKVRVKVDSGKVEVWLDGQSVVTYDDKSPLGYGHIGLEFNLGKVEFRSIRIQKLDLP